MVGLAITEASYNGDPLKNVANKKINLKKNVSLPNQLYPSTKPLSCAS